MFQFIDEHLLLFLLFFSGTGFVISFYTIFHQEQLKVNILGVLCFVYLLLVVVSCHRCCSQLLGNLSQITCCGMFNHVHLLLVVFYGYFWIPLQHWAGICI